MTDSAAPDDPRPPADVPTVVRKKNRISLIWLVPIVAAIAGAVLIYRTWASSGPEVTITFATASGLQAGQTELRFKDVTVGVVRTITLSEDWSKVMVTADIRRDAADLAREGTRFWVVRPRLALSGVSGLGTLLSGAYIEADTPGGGPDVDRPSQRSFEGLEEPPEIRHDAPGSRFLLRTADLGSLEVGSPVYFRRIAVGRVTDYELDSQSRDVRVEVFIDAPNDRLVTEGTRFWNASGIDMQVSADGVRLHAESLVSLVLGGIAFEPSDLPAAEPASDNTAFQLFPNRQAALAPPDGEPLPIRMRFDQSVRGLAVGAPIDFKGMTLGSVTALTMDYDMQKRDFHVLVDANLYPMRMGPLYERMRDYVGAGNDETVVLGPMIERGLRAQLRTANLLTGQLYIALDDFPKAPKVTYQHTDPITIPTVSGEFDQLQQQIASIVSKIERLPLDEIAGNLRDTLGNSARLVSRVDRQVVPETQSMLREATRTLNDVRSLVASDAALPLNLDRAMQELARAARSLRVLTDYLQTNPEALLRGRSPDTLPPTR
ncbi:MCE family protein [Verticiella sediminum]|uniref:MCE family protein n=1 Tax=Verticiella sediminum TaxID=1247510 RepID=A0A556A875_9BURK|nr:MlaD family protein [Verticiella sediminum]TSH89088.1 MCE family protein [Verticiella sediminum]